LFIALAKSSCINQKFKIILNPFISALNGKMYGLGLMQQFLHVTKKQVDLFIPHIHRLHLVQ